MMKRLISILLLILLLLPSCTPVPMTEDSSDTDPNIGLTDARPAYKPWDDAEETALQFLSVQNAIVDCSERAYSYEDMVSDLEALASAHPTRFSYYEFGRSVLGRALYCAKLGNPSAPKQILVSAGIHGREYLTPLLVMKQMEFYLTYYDTGDHNGFSYASLFDEYCFYVVPMTNPDGIMISQEGISTVMNTALTEAIRTAYYADFKAGYTDATTLNEYLQIWKANANCVDLNRNFDARWSEVETGMYRKSHKNYKGASAASEPETRAMAELTEGLPNVQAVLCIHSQGEVLYWDCGQRGSLRQRTLAFTESLSHRNGYRVVNEQNNDASFSDWCALEQGLIAVTVETGIGACPLEIDQFSTIWSDNYDLFALSAVFFEVE